ncbi:hypothetical protein [Acidiphilium sp.]|uniref:hypothetical protein n=1 Tax=Acidiphilium TaxID=522 RepID=UPI0025892405|nr:hypothetical protein [Acidiphilium sp.]
MKKRFLMVTLVLTTSQPLTAFSAPVLQSGVQGKMDRVAISFVNSHWSEWSLPNSMAIPYIRNDLAKNVYYFGTRTPRYKIITKVEEFAKKWKTRLYTDIPSESNQNKAGIKNIHCSTITSECKISGVVYWSFEAPQQRLHSIGLANFHFILLLQNGITRIESESTSVISRKTGDIGKKLYFENKVDNKPKSNTIISQNDKFSISGDISNKKSDHAKRWFALTNDDECIPSVPRDPAKLIRFDRLNGLDDAVNIFERSHGMPVGVTVAEPESNGMETVYTFFRTEDACEAYAKTKQGSLKQLE